MKRSQLKNLIHKIIKEELESKKKMRVWDVYIHNNYYDGKYPTYFSRPYPVLATSSQEARNVVLNNADAILQDLLTRRYHSGKKVLPKSSALPIEDKHVLLNNIKKSTRSTFPDKYMKLFSPDGIKLAKVDNGEVLDIKNQ